MLLLPNEPFCLIGDLNNIRDNNERANCIHRSKDSEVFEGFIKDCNLWNVLIEEFKFTWFGHSDKKAALIVL